MPDGSQNNKRHPVFVRGCNEAGPVIAQIIHDTDRRRLPGFRGNLSNRGFDPARIRAIELGNEAVTAEELTTICYDFYTRFPKEAGIDPIYGFVKNLLSDPDCRPEVPIWAVGFEPKFRPARPPTDGVRVAVSQETYARPVVEVEDVSFSVTSHGDRILLLHRACGVVLHDARINHLRGETPVDTISEDTLDLMALNLDLHREVLLGQRHFDRDLTPVQAGADWQGPPSLFIGNDQRAGTAWRMTLDLYRQVSRQIVREYGIDDEVRTMIETGTINIPVPVHIRLMHVIDEFRARFSNARNSRALQTIQRLDENIPRSLKTNGNEPPCADWFRQSA